MSSRAQQPAPNAHTDIRLPQGLPWPTRRWSRTTYYYVVSASNGNCLSAPSATVPATPNQVCALTAPTGVLATAGNQQVTITWNISDAGSLSYVVSRGTAAGGPYGTVIPNPNPAGTIDTVVNTGQAIITWLLSAMAVAPRPIRPRLLPSRSARPLVPINVAAVADNSNGNINVSWAPATTGPTPTGYTVSHGRMRLDRHRGGHQSDAHDLCGPWDRLTAGNDVLLCGECQQCEWHLCVGQLRCCVCCVLQFATVPTGVTATAGISRVTVSWTASTKGPTSYQVKRGTLSQGIHGT